MKSINIKYGFILTIILLFLSIHLGSPATASAQSDEQEPAMAIEDTKVPPSEEKSKAKEGGSKSTGEENVSEKKGKTSGKKGKASVKRGRNPGDAGGPTDADVRAAKKEQGLKGPFFQDSKSKKYFLQDFDGNMYKFVDNKWVKIKEAEDSK